MKINTQTITVKTFEFTPEEIKILKHIIGYTVSSKVAKEMEGDELKTHTFISDLYNGMCD